MLIIRKEQLQAFEQVAMAHFEEEMVAHCKAFSTPLCNVIGEAQVRLTVQKAIERCRKYGFTNRGPIRLFIEMAFLFGSAFDTDPQYAWSSNILSAPHDQMVRAVKLYDQIIEYQDQVPKIEPANTIKALDNLSSLAEKHSSFSSAEFNAAMLSEMRWLSPEKVSRTGTAELTEVILEACTLAETYEVSIVFGRALIGMLMFAFGHGFMEDPLYPWAQHFSTKQLSSDPEERARHLQKKALAYLMLQNSQSQERNAP